MSEVNATKIKMERFKYYHGGYRKMSAGMRAERGLNDTTKQGWRDLPRQVAQTVGTRHAVSNAWARTVAEVQLTGEGGKRRQTGVRLERRFGARLWTFISRLVAPLTRTLLKRDLTNETNSLKLLNQLTWPKWILIKWPILTTWDR